MELSRSGRLWRLLIKRYLYAMLSLREAACILLGRSKPMIRFTVEADPPSVYFNFRVRPDRIDALARHLDLPAGFSLAKIRCLEDDPEPYDCLTLNVYRVSGITNGLRAEWSVYVTDPEGKPRYMVVEARASGGSMDPVDIITRASRVELAVVDGTLETFVASENDSHFRASLPIPADPNASAAPAAREWIEANDMIYWRNGVCDRVFYDAKMANARVGVISPDSATIEDTTSWREFIEPTPERLLVFSSALYFVISPWWNV